MRFDYEKSHPDLISPDFDNECNDCKILSVAQWYKKYVGAKVLIVSDDFNLQERAKSENIDSYSGEEFKRQRNERKRFYDNMNT